MLYSYNVSLIFGRTNPGEIGALVLDATVQENHSFKNRVTNFPIEDNSSISDHVIREPESISINGFITNTPVMLLGGAVTAVKNSAFNLKKAVENFKDNNTFTNDRVEEGLTELLSMAGFSYPTQEGDEVAVKNPVQLVEVVTGLRKYSDMVITSIEIPRNKDTGEALRFTINLQKVIKTHSRLDVVKVNENATTTGEVNKKALPKQAKGQSNTGTPTPDVATSNLLKIARTTKKVVVD